MYEQLYRDCLFAGVSLYERNGKVIADGEPGPDLLRRIQYAGRGLPQYLVLQQALAKESNLPPPKREQKDVHPLSPYQQGFYAESLERGAGAPGLIQTGVFDIAFVPSKWETEEVFNAVLKEHPILRALFFTAPGKGGEWKSVVPLPQTIEYHVCESQGDFEETLEAVARRYNMYAPSLDKDPLLKLALVTNGNEGAGLVLSFHHIIMDGWSMSLFLEIFMQGLEKLKSGGTVASSRSLFDYGDYARWVKTAYLPAVADRQLSYWRRKLAFATFVPSFPTDFARNSQVSLQAQESKMPSGAFLKEELHESVLAALQGWTSSFGCTSFCALHVALCLALCLYGGDTNEPILTISANRGQTEGVEEIIGAFVNVVPLLAPLNFDESVVNAVQESYACLREAMANQDMPFFRIAESVSRLHTKDWHPVGRTLLLLQNMHGIEGEFGALPRSPQVSYTEYELAFLMWDYGSRGAAVTLEYDDNLYTETTARALLAAFIRFCKILPQAHGVSVRECLKKGAAKTIAPKDRYTWLDKALFDKQISLVKVTDGTILGVEDIIRAAVRTGRDLVKEGPFSKPQSLVVVSTWEEAHPLLETGHTVCLLNHLPTAVFLYRNSSMLGRCRIALSNAEGTIIAVISPQELQKVSCNARYIIASTPDESISDGSPFPAYYESYPPVHDGWRWTRILLPCASACKIWKNGNFFNLDQLKEKYFGSAKATLSLLSPLSNDSPLYLDGEITLWLGAEEDYEELIQKLPKDLCPVHQVSLTQLPLNEDGNIDRRVLDFLPLVSKEIAKRLASGRSWRMKPSTHCTKAIKKLKDIYGWKKLFHGYHPAIKKLPEPGVLFTQKGLFVAPVAPPHIPFAAWDAPFRKGGCCLALNQAGQAGEALMAELANIFPETSFWLIGENKLTRSKTLLGLEGKVESIIQKLIQREADFHPGAFFHLLNEETLMEQDLNAVIPRPFWQRFPHCLGLTVLFADKGQLLPQPATPWGGLIISNCGKARKQYQEQLPIPTSNSVLFVPLADSFEEIPAEQTAAWILAALQSGEENLLVGLDPEYAVRQGLLQGFCFAENHIEISSAKEPLPYPLVCPGHPIGASFTGTGESVHNGMLRFDRSSFGRQVERVWNDVLEIEHAPSDANFFDLGGSSVLAPVMRDSLLRTLGVDIGAVGVFTHPCLREMQEAVMALLEEKAAVGQEPLAQEVDLEDRQQKRVARRQTRQIQREKVGKA